MVPTTRSMSIGSNKNTTTTPTTPSMSTNNNTTTTINSTATISETPPLGYQLRGGPEYNVIGWAIHRERKPVHSVQITKVPARITPTTHLQSLRNPRSPDQHFRSMLSPALCNISDAYIRHLEYQFDAGHQLIGSRNSHWRIRNKTDEEVIRQIDWNFLLESHAAEWVLGPNKAEKRKVANEKAAREQQEHTDRFNQNLQPMLPCWFREHPEEARRLPRLLQAWYARSKYTKNPQFAGAVRKAAMNPQCAEALAAKREFRTERERLEEHDRVEGCKTQKELNDYQLEKSRKAREEYDAYLQHEEEKVLNFNAFKERIAKRFPEAEPVKGPLTTTFTESVGAKGRGLVYSNNQLLSNNEQATTETTRSRDTSATTLVALKESTSTAAKVDIASSPPNDTLLIKIDSSITSDISLADMSTECHHTQQPATANSLLPSFSPAFIEDLQFQTTFHTAEMSIESLNLGESAPRKYLTFIEDDEEDDKPQPAYNYVNTYNLKSCLKRTNPARSSKIVTFNHIEPLDVFEVPNEESARIPYNNQGQTRYTAANAADLLFSDSEDDDDDDEDGIDWGNVPAGPGISAQEQSTQVTPPATPSGSSYYTADNIDELLASGADDSDSDSDNDEDWSAESFRPPQQHSASSQPQEQKQTPSESINTSTTSKLALPPETCSGSTYYTAANAHELLFSLDDSDSDSNEDDDTWWNYDSLAPGPPSSYSSSPASSFNSNVDDTPTLAVEECPKILGEEEESERQKCLVHEKAGEEDLITSRIAAFLHDLELEVGEGEEQVVDEWYITAYLELESEPEPEQEAPAFEDETGNIYDADDDDAPRYYNPNQNQNQNQNPKQPKTITFTTPQPPLFKTHLTVDHRRPLQRGEETPLGICSWLPRPLGWGDDLLRGLEKEMAGKEVPLLVVTGVRGLVCRLDDK